MCVEDYDGTNYIYLLRANSDYEDMLIYPTMLEDIVMIYWYPTRPEDIVIIYWYPTRLKDILMIYLYPSRQEDIVMIMVYPTRLEADYIDVPLCTPTGSSLASPMHDNYIYPEIPEDDYDDDIYDNGRLQYYGFNLNLFTIFTHRHEFCNILLHAILPKGLLQVATHLSGSWVNKI